MKKIFKLILNVIPREWLIRLSYLASPILGLWFKGSKFTDPINGKSYRQFLPYGYGVQRPNALSPETLSLERHRLMWLFLKEETSFFTSKLKVLHLAPEQCFLKRFKSLDNLEYTSADLYSPIVDVKADINDLPFEDNSFDVVICNHVLEHIESDHQAISELYRVMKKGGFGIFQVPMDYNLKTTYEDFTIVDPKERAKHFGQYDHVRVYGWDYFERLKKVGFEAQAIHYVTNIGEAQAKRYSLDLSEHLPYITKPL